MADVLTETYQFVLPEVGASDGTWGGKLNGDVAKMEVLLKSGFSGGTPTDIGQLIGTALPLTIDGDKTFSGITAFESTAPQLRFTEVDQVDPEGRYRFIANDANFYFQRSDSVDWASQATIFSYIDPPTDVFNIFPNVSLSKNLTVLGDASIRNTFPVLWFSDTNAPTNKDWTIWSSTNVFKLGMADAAGVPVTDYISMFDGWVLIEQAFKLQNSNPTIFFADTVPSGDQYLTLTAGGGLFRFLTSDSAGATVSEIARLQNTIGLQVTDDIISLNGDITGKLVHKTDGGYFYLGSHDISAHGNGSGRLWWSQNNKQLTVQSSAGNDATIAAAYLQGNGDGITGLAANQISSDEGAVGTYRMLLSTSAGDTAGAEIVGSSLKIPNLKVNTDNNSLSVTFGNGPSGTWRAMQTTSCASNERAVALYLRVA